MQNTTDVTKFIHKETFLAEKKETYQIHLDTKTHRHSKK